MHPIMQWIADAPFHIMDCHALLCVTLLMRLVMYRIADALCHVSDC